MAYSKIGWYQVEEDFRSDGVIELAVFDQRTNELVCFDLQTFVEYDKFIDLLDANRDAGTLSQINVFDGEVTLKKVAQ